MMNRKGCERIRSWVGLISYASTFLKELKKLIINFNFLFQLAQIIFDDSLNHTIELDRLFGTFF